MTYEGEIPEDRELTEEEIALIRWMLMHGASKASEFLPQLDRARVSSRCSCGCASIDLAIDGVSPSIGLGMQILADFEYRTTDGYDCGAFVFENGGLLAGLEIWSRDGRWTPSRLPDPAILVRLIDS
jgi:hypothetical protein